MLNQIALIGRLTKDPEIKLVGKDQNSVVRFILAVNRPKYGDSKPQADFIPVVAWRERQILSDVTSEKENKCMYRADCRLQNGKKTE